MADRNGVPESVGALMQRDPWFSYDAKGDPITRRATCECGRQFLQRQLSARFLEIVEKWSSNAIALVTRDIPDLFVPVHCPPCERQDLTFAARRAEFNRRDSLDARPEAAD